MRELRRLFILQSQKRYSIVFPQQKLETLSNLGIDCMDKTLSSQHPS